MASHIKHTCTNEDHVTGKIIALNLHKPFEYQNVIKMNWLWESKCDALSVCEESITAFIEDIC